MMFRRILRQHLRLPITKYAILIVIFGVGATIVLASGCSNASSDSNNSDSDNTQASNTGTTLTVKPKGNVTQDAVEQMVTRKMGSSGINSQPLIRHIDLVPGPDGVFVDMYVNRPPSCHPGVIVTYATDMSKQFMSSLFLYPNVAKVQLNLFGTTDNISDKDKLAARVLITKDSANKIDWFNFSADTAPQLATEFWIEPTIYNNYKQYGGQTITDPAQAQAAGGSGAVAAAPTP